MIKGSLKNLSSAELNKIIAKTHEEVERRQSIKLAEQEIKKILSKHNVTFFDLGLKQLKRHNRLRLQKATPKVNSKKRPSPKKVDPNIETRQKPRTDNRANVSPKYINPEGVKVWSGRGRAPSWVNDICEVENISLQKFKLDGRFKFKKK